MPRVALFGLGQEGKSVTVSSQQLRNIFVEISDKPDRGILTIYRTPGLLLFTDFGETPVRGMHAVGLQLYVVHRKSFWEIDNAGVKTLRGTINTSVGQVSISDNGNQIMLVDGQNGWIFNRTTLVFSQIIDADFPSGANVCVFSDSFFLVNKPDTTGQIFKSAAFDGFSWDGLDFATAEHAPDNLVNIFPHQGFLALLGDVTTEGWQNVGGSGFPYRRVAGGVLEWGLAARFSVAKYDNSFMFLAKNRLGGVQVVLVESFTPKVVSGPDMDTEIAEIKSKFGVSDAVAFSYFESGHSFYHISFPAAGVSWIYCLDSDSWSQMISSSGRRRANMGIRFGEKIIVSDWAHGKIYEFSDRFSDDNGEVIECELIGKHLNFEDRTTISNLWLDVEPGTGGAGQDPHIVLSISKDGGRTFGVGRPASIGKAGAYETQCRWSRVSRGKDFVPKFRFTDLAKLVITGAWLR